MENETLISILLQTANSFSTIVILIGVLGVMAIMAVFVTKLGNIILPEPKETHVSDFLPFSRLDKDGATIYLRNGALARVFEITGADTTMMMPEERIALMESRKQWIDSMSELSVVSRVITIREKVPLVESSGHDDLPLLKTISKLWLDSLHRIFRNKHYIVLSVEGSKDAKKNLDQASNAMIAILEPYKPTLISEKVMDTKFDKSPFWLFSHLVSPVSAPKPIVNGEEGSVLNSLLSTDYIHFTKDEGIIRFFSGDKEKMAICIGIRKPGDFMDEQMVADFLSIDCEVCVSHNIKAIPYSKATLLLVQQRRMAYLTTFSESVRAQYTTALEWLDPSDVDGQTINEYALTITVFGESKEELRFGQDEIEKIGRLYGVTPVREGWGAQAVFFSQFPTYDIFPRTYKYLSRVVACAVYVDKVTEGLQKSDWGNVPLSYFRTVMGTPYAFQFHVSSDAYAPAHTVLIGPTGQGKTTFFSFMAGQALRIPNLHVYFFDRNKGAKVFALLNGAPYVPFDGSKEAATLNPFSLPDKSYNRTFLRGWLRNITGCADSFSESEIARAVTTAYDYLEPQDRNLKNLYASCFALNGNMRRELKRWVADEQYGRIFNNEHDSLDLRHRYMGLDFTDIFADGTLAPAVISYIMHRIHTIASVTGDPTMIMIDETAPMLEHEMFKENFIVGLREGRKKRQAFLCAFQQPRFLDEHGLGDVIRGQCQTSVFFRNLQAKEEDYASWNLSPRELAFVMGKDFVGHKYAVLLKKPFANESVILDVDLSGLGPYLKVYSSGTNDVRLVESLSNTVKDTDMLVQQFLRRSNGAG